MMLARWLVGAAVLAISGNSNAAEVCHPISKDMIEQQWARYSAQPGLEKIPSSKEYECIALSESKEMKLVCSTRPGHPAHPTIVVRTVTQKSDGIYIRMEADTAADCAEFAKVMAEFQRLNEGLKRSFATGN